LKSIANTIGSSTSAVILTTPLRSDDSIVKQALQQHTDEEGDKRMCRKQIRRQKCRQKALDADGKRQARQS